MYSVLEFCSNILRVSEANRHQTSQCEEQRLHKTSSLKQETRESHSDKDSINKHDRVNYHDLDLMSCEIFMATALLYTVFAEFGSLYLAEWMSH